MRQYFVDIPLRVWHNQDRLPKCPFGVMRSGFVTEPHVNPNESANSTSLGLLERVKARDQSAWNRMVSLYSPLLDYWLGKAALQAADAAERASGSIPGGGAEDR